MGKIFQSYNKKIGAYVKGKVVENEKGGKFFLATNVKQQEPKKPFKNIPIKKKKRK